MNDLRKEIEQQFAAAGLLDDKPAVTEAEATPDTLVAAPDDAASAAQPDDEAAAIVVPSSFTAEFAADFKNLSPQWQQFLCAHEAENDAKINSYADKLKGYDWVERLFDLHAARLEKAGIHEFAHWLSALAEIDAAISDHPAETLQAIAACYGVKITTTPKADDTLTHEVIGRLCALERHYRAMQDYLHQEKNQRLVDILRMFGKATDADGNPTHPYFDAVKQQVFDLLQSGAATDVSEAYQQALWLNPAVREKLIEQEINTRAAEAERSKQAAFAPKGKAEAPDRELTLREEIEKNMAALMD